MGVYNVVLIPKIFMLDAIMLSRHKGQTGRGGKKKPNKNQDRARTNPLTWEIVGWTRVRFE